MTFVDHKAYNTTDKRPHSLDYISTLSHTERLNMPIEFKERSVTPIITNLNAFWSATLMTDRHVIDQIWRGYFNLADNLYTQLYQLNYAKALETIPHKWLSHWERFDCSESNRVGTFNSLYPYAYSMPENVKSVYLLRESPREISVLPALTMILNEGTIITPDGQIRFPGDIVYLAEDFFNFEINCPTCNATGLLDGNTCPTCDGNKTLEGSSSDAGFGVDTVKYYKRADNIADYEEGITPLGDFVVDEENKIIAFKTQPYAELWSEYTVRDTEIIYDNFGTLIQFYKKDSYRYLRQLQGLWYAYWNGSDIDNIRIGLNVVTDLPFITDSGYVENISYIENSFLTSREISDFDVNAPVNIPVFPPQTETGIRKLTVKIRNKPQYIFEEGIDYTIFNEYEDANDYDAWYTFDDFNGINSVPSVEPQAYIKFNETESVNQIADGDVLDITFEDGSGSYVITVAGRDYIIPDEYMPEVVVNQYLNRYTPLTDAIGVYDYINYPKWWENLLGYRSGLSFYKRNGRVKFDSGVPMDSDIHLDSYHKNFAKTELMYHHTFLVSLEEAAVPHTIEDVQIIRSFLDTIKPHYTHYIIRATLDFEDKAETREAHFCITGLLNFESTQGPNQRLDDPWVRKSLDSEYGMDNTHEWENLFIAKLPLDGINFISDTEVHSCTMDSLNNKTLDSGRKLDSFGKASVLEIIKE